MRNEIILNCSMDKDTAQVVEIALRLFLEDLNRIIERNEHDSHVIKARMIASYVQRDLSEKIRTWPSVEDFDKEVLAAFKNDDKPN